MGVYTRFKQKGSEGFRAIVELLESTPMARRQKMIDVGMVEDPAYTLKALQYVLNFEDVLNLTDLELADLTALVPPRTIAYAIRAARDDVKARFLRNSKPRVGAEVKSYMEVEIGLREMGGAQLKMIEATRQLERRGIVQTKRIPQ